MYDLGQKIDEVDAALIGYLANGVAGRSGPDVSDLTIFIFEGGSVSNTVPATPEGFRGDKWPV